MKILFLAAAAAGFACAAHAQEKFHVVMPVVVDPRGPLTTETARRDCGVDMLLSNYLYQKVESSYPGASRSKEGDDPGPDKLLRITILNAHAEGRFAWSGPKSITIRAEVVQHAKTISSTILRRQAYGGFLGSVGFMGTCQVLETLALGLGEDLADWLPAAIVPGRPAPVAPAPRKK